MRIQTTKFTEKSLRPVDLADLSGPINRKVIVYCNFKIGYAHRVTNCDLGVRFMFEDHAQAFSAQFGGFTYIANGTTIGQARIGKYCSIGPDRNIDLGLHPDYVSLSTPLTFSSPEPRSQLTFTHRV